MKQFDKTWIFVVQFDKAIILDQPREAGQTSRKEVNHYVKSKNALY